MCVCQYKRVHRAVESSGGHTLLRDASGSETDDFLVAPGVCVMMMDIKEQNTLPPVSQQWIVHIMETLKRLVIEQVVSEVLGTCVCSKGSQGSKLKKIPSRLLATIKKIKVAKCKNLVAR